MSGFGNSPLGHHPFGHPSSPTAVIQDLAYNGLAPISTAQMLGWIEPPTLESFGLDIYRFLLQSIREEDGKNTLFLKRFLQGPQLIWERTQTKIFSIKSLWDVINVEPEFLPFLAPIVGWTGSLASIIEALDDDTLRRLIATSVALWRSRGPEDTTVDVLQLTTKAQARIWNWFDLRWVMDETALGVDHQGRDPWMIELPGSPDMDEYRSNLRIVDDGTLNRTLVIDLVKLMRGCNERVEVSYINFMDLFTTKGDDAKWNVISGAMIVADGVARLEDNSQTELALVDHEPTEWLEYVIFSRIKGAAGGDFGVAFYNDADGENGYYAVLDIDGNNVKILRKISGAITTLLTVSFMPWGTLYADVYYGIRIQTAVEGSSTRIKVYVDADEIISILDSTYSSGTIGLWHETGTIIDSDEVEMFMTPLTTVLVDINS